MSAELIAPARQEPLGPVAHDTASARAFDAVYNEHFDRLRRFVLGMTGQATLAEDIAQETLLRAYVRMDTFDFDRPLWPWLKTVATRLVFDNNRSQRRESLEADPADEIAEDRFDVTVERELLKEAMRSLPVRQRVAVTLRYLEDWKAAEVAEALGLTRVAAEQLLLRARRRLSTEYLALGGSETTPALRVVVWPLLALVGGLRDRLARFRQFMGSSAAAQLPLTVDAVTQMVAAAAVSGVLLSGGVALAAPAPSDHITMVQASAFRMEEIRSTSTARVTEKAAPARKASRAMAPAAPKTVASASSAETTASKSAENTPAPTKVTKVAVQTQAPVDQGPVGSGTLTKERSAEKYLLKGRVEGRAGDLAPGSDAGADADCRSQVVGNACEALDTVEEALPAEAD